MTAFTITSRAVIAMFASMAAAGAAATPLAQASFAGENGPIAFTRFVDPMNEDSAQIFTVPPGGGQPVQLTTAPGAGWAPDFLPDGSAIAVERRFGGHKPDAIFMVGLDGGAPVRLSSGCTGRCLGDGGPAWSPDGSQLLFGRALGPEVKGNAAEIDLMLMNRDGSGRRLIRRFGRTRDGREPRDVRWSPDGRRIAVTLETLGKDGDHSAGLAVFVMDSRGHHLHRITPPRLHGGNVDWSPDGRWIVFASNRNVRRVSELWVVRPSGSGLRRLRHLPGGIDFDPTWSPDGHRIAFSRATPKTPPHIWTISRDGTDAQQVTRGPNVDIEPDWGPSIAGETP